MKANREAGFTLFETIVAFLVLALVAGALQLSLSGGWRGLKAVRGEQAALQIAKARLAEAGLDSPLTERTDEGATDDGFAWSRDIRRHAPSSGFSSDATGPAGYWVTVSVRWSDGAFRPERSVSLTTLKIGRAE